MCIKYEICAKLGTYEKNGEAKNRYKQVGKIIETQNGLSMTMDASFNPAGVERNEDGSIWLSLFEPRGNQQNGQRQSPQASNFDSGDIPF